MYKHFSEQGFMLYPTSFIIMQVLKVCSDAHLHISTFRFRVEMAKRRFRRQINESKEDINMTPGLRNLTKIALDSLATFE